MASGLWCGGGDWLQAGTRFVRGMVIAALRRWHAERGRPGRTIGDIYQMTEGRLCQVHLLDGRKLELLVQPKLLSRELLDLVSSHFNLKEKEYFGITFIDNYGQCNWLQLDRRVLDHDFSKKPGPVALNFSVRFYIESISFLKENTTVELFFLNAKACVFKEDIEVESETAFKLAAYTLQEAKGDFKSDESARSELQKLPAVPTRVLKEHPSLAYCEDKVIEYYKKLKGITRGQAIVQYLTLVESLPTYGVHYFEVKDKQGIPWWLGISYKGIGQYDLQDKVKPRKLFQWKQLENLYFREKKFAVEVNEPHRGTISKRAFGQTGFVIYTWYASHSLIKTIWVMAISQHQFYLDRKQSKAKIPTARSLGDIAMDLTDNGTQNVTLKVNLETKNQLIMASNTSLVSSESQDESIDEQKKEKLAEINEKKKNLQDILAQKLDELKKICLREAELTGRLPNEYPLSAGETAPHVRRRIGTAFKLDDLSHAEDPDLHTLESRFSLQQKIVEAAKKLATEPELCKTVRKKRKQNLYDAVKKLQEIEDAINEYRIRVGKKPTQRASLIFSDEVIPSESSSLSDSLIFDDDDSVVSQRTPSRSVQYSPRHHPPQSFNTSVSDHVGRFDDSDDIQSVSHSLYRESPAVYDHYSYATTGRFPSMPQTPLLSHSISQPRQRSGSLESQFVSESDPEKPRFLLDQGRSNSTEVLDDGSSYTSQSSTECNSTTRRPNHHYRTVGNMRHKKQNYANTGSMPNLAQNDLRHYTYQSVSPQMSTAYCITGYVPYTDTEPFSNGGCVYENESEGRYYLNTSYPAPYYGHEKYLDYPEQDETDHFAHNPYATIRPPRGRQVTATQDVTKNIQKALVAEQLRGWYKRAAVHRDHGRNLQAGYEFDRRSMQSLGYSSAPGPFTPNNRVPSFPSVSSGARNWQSQMNVGSVDYEASINQQLHYSSPHGRSYSSTPLHSRYPAECMSRTNELWKVSAPGSAVKMFGPGARYITEEK
ncbi:FERM domain-containing protein 4B-like isoform X2 [Polypterus senegalus]|uniref:FERM domain-containing protein 4B-like isoform X2 n=1 Tax=Polypterus senegalus TaxID=55291 RepID=UPI001966626F|nr:FERM domain-containing protein 4B-like isoform X2 [Polypterus senegalus]